MRALLLLATSLLIGCATHPTRYTGVVRRASDHKPVAGVPVAAVAHPGPHILFMVPRSDTRVAVTHSGRDGTFSFVLPYRSRQLSFTALGTRTERLVSPYTYEVSFGDVSVRDPSPHRLNIITIPDGFKPSAKR